MINYDIDNLIRLVAESVKSDLKNTQLETPVFVFRNFEEYIDQFVPQLGLRDSADIMARILSQSDEEPAIFSYADTGDSVSYSEHIIDCVRHQLVFMVSENLTKDVEFCALFLDHRALLFSKVNLLMTEKELTNIRENHSKIFECVRRDLLEPMTETDFLALREGVLSMPTLFTILNLCHSYNFSITKFGIPTEPYLRCLLNSFSKNGGVSENTDWKSVHQNAGTRFFSELRP